MSTETAKDVLQLAASRAEDVVQVASDEGKEVLADHVEDRIEATAERAATKAIAGFLLHLGIDTAIPIAMQKDFAALRSFRESVELVKKRGHATAVAVVVTGIMAVFWAAINNKL